MARHEGRSGGAARSGARREKKQSAKGLTCHKCGEVGHIQRNCHKGRSQASAQSAEGDSVRGGRQGERGRGKGRGRGSHGRGGRGGNQAAAGGGASAVASSAATLGGGGAAAGSSGSSVAGRAVYVGGAGNSVGSTGVDSSEPLSQAGPCLVNLLLVRRLQRRRLHIRRRGPGGTPIFSLHRQVLERNSGVR